MRNYRSAPFKFPDFSSFFSTAHKYYSEPTQNKHYKVGLCTDTHHIQNLKHSQSDSTVTPGIEQVQKLNRKRLLSAQPRSCGRYFTRHTSNLTRPTYIGLYSRYAWVSHESSDQINRLPGQCRRELSLANHKSPNNVHINKIGKHLLVMLAYNVTLVQSLYLWERIYLVRWG